MDALLDRRRPDPPARRLLHRWAVLLVCLTWPLIWIGGIVTTYDAGMAVPDWPRTYGYNMFLYPWQTWLFGPFDLFVEHGHRLLASLVGLLTIVLVVIAWFTEPRRWVVGLTIAALVGVIFQGILGGLRVVLDARTLALAHGCVGPVFFALCAMLCGVTSRWWERYGEEPPERAPGNGAMVLAGVMSVGAYLQLVLGANLRHLSPTDTVAVFRHLVAGHVALAFSLGILAVMLAWQISRCGDLTLSRPARLLVGLVALQIFLGLGTWVANYAWPWGLEQLPGMAGYRLQGKGLKESLVVTAHVATGSLIVAVSGLVWLRTARARRIAAGAVGQPEELKLDRRVAKA